MFRRKRPAPTADPVIVGKIGGKGRPTPSRKQAEAARRVGLAATRTPPSAGRGKGKAGTTRAERMEARAVEYEALRSGDEAAMPPMDRGADRKLVRDYIDSRISIGELGIPVFLVILVVGLVFGRNNPNIMLAVNNILILFVIVMIVDFIWLSRKAKRLVSKRFPEEKGRRGTSWYAIRRAMQFRRLRLPRPQVRLGTRV